MILRLSLNLPEDAAYIRMTLATARAVLQSLRVQASMIDDAETVLTELYSNVLHHAQSEEGRFSIMLDYYAERLVVTVEDRGQGFSFKDVPPIGSVRPDFDGNERIEEFGLQLVAALSDKLEFHRHDDVGMQIRAEIVLAYQTEDADRIDEQNADVALERGALGAGESAVHDGGGLDRTGRVERRQQDRFLADLRERVRRMTHPEEVIADAVRSVGEFLGVSRCVFADIDIEADTCTIPLDYRADDSVVSMAGTFPISAFGPFLVAEYGAGRTVAVEDTRLDPVRVPADYLAAYEAVACRAFVAAPVLHSARLVSVIAVHSVTPRRWEPEEVELLRIVVERTWLTVEVTYQHRALVREAQELREAHQRTARILESITDGFHALDHDWRFTYLNAQAERMVSRKGQELLGQNIWEAFPEAIGSTFEREYRRAMAEQVAVSFEEFYPPLDAWLDVQAFPSGDGLSVFFQNVNARKQAEAERERLLAEERARAEREALVNRIGQALLATTDPAVIQERVVALLGEALGVDRCYLSFWDAAQDRILVIKDYHRSDLPSVAGEYPASEYASVMDALFVRGTAVVPDVRSSGLPDTVVAMMEGFALHCVLAVPFFEGKGRIAAALMLAMADAPRAWTPEEVSLVETVAALARTAVDSARAAQQEHTIANQLQKALQPPTPASVPGLALADYYRPAWQDQGVGGDFSDVFSDNGGVTFLVMGDLSGKGLSAASQVATVRHMLRFALLNGGSVVGSVTSLNRTLADHDLLTGFATLFVGRYDAPSRTLTYVNCGQDAGLVLRAATGKVEPLPTTGPVLGAFAGVEYEEHTITLEVGDALALYTDGLTEAGPTRTALLTGDGVANLFAQQAGQTAPRIIVERLMAGVDAYAGAGVRDDQCLLVGVVT